MWNPSTWEYQCDKWYKLGQYLNHEDCVCKNKLVGRLISECTSIINETMMNNNNNYDNDYNAITYVFIGLFSLLLLVIICFCVFAYFKWFKSKYTLTSKDNYKSEY